MRELSHILDSIRNGAGIELAPLRTVADRHKWLANGSKLEKSFGLVFVFLDLDLRAEFVVL